MMRPGFILSPGCHGSFFLFKVRNILFRLFCVTSLHSETHGNNGDKDEQGKNVTEIKAGNSREGDDESLRKCWKVLKVKVSLEEYSPSICFIPTKLLTIECTRSTFK